MKIHIVEQSHTDWF